MSSTIQLIDFELRHQVAAAKLVNLGLGEHFGHVDESMNPDLFDITKSYGDGHFLVASDGDLVVGTGGLVPQDHEVGQIVRMHTASSHRRQGVATRILDALEKRAASSKLRSLILETNVDWQDAIAFYKRAGYLELGRNEVGIRFRKSLDRADG